MLFSTAFLPPVEYFYFIDKSDFFCTEEQEHYQKQSYRNRATIVTANGVRNISIPVVHDHSKMMIKEVRIDYKTNWQRIHWRTVQAAYNSSPFFIYYADYLSPFFEKKYRFLIDYNQELIALMMRFLKLEKANTATQEYRATCPEDLRNEIHPKKARKHDYRYRITAPYQQVFQDKFGFIPNLSILDLLFNKGTESMHYIRSLKLGI